MPATTKPFYLKFYYLLHLFNVTSYLFFRKFLTFPYNILQPYYYSITKEQMTFCVAMMIVLFRYQKYSTQEQMFISLLNHFKVAILVNFLWSYSFWFGIIFGVSSLMILLFSKIPVYEGPSNLIDMTPELLPILFPYGNKTGKDLVKERKLKAKSDIEYNLGIIVNFL